MSRADGNSIVSLLDSVETDPATLLVVNRTQPAPLLSLLERAFACQPVHVVEKRMPGPVEDEVILLTADGQVASSPLADVAESFLLINADRFRTGANDLAARSVPAVLRELTDIDFELEGYPASSKQKLLLIVMSRFVEARALRAGAGELHTGFQRLSRLDDEYGTRTVYDRLGDTDVETHVYGVDTRDTAIPAGVQAHSGEGEAYRRSWFVVFEPDAGQAAEPVALLAWETGENVWRGMWTFDAARTASVADYIRSTLAD